MLYVEVCVLVGVFFNIYWFSKILVRDVKIVIDYDVCIINLCVIIKEYRKL